MTLGLEIKYNTPLHNRVKEAILQRKRAAERKLADRYTVWEEAEKSFLAYIPSTEEDAARSSSRKSGSPQYTSVTIPYSYAVLLTAHTYWSAVFLNRSPVFQYTARHGEAQQQVQAIEALIDYQLRVGNMLVPLYNWLMDAGKYGVGILSNYWAKDVSVITEIVEVPKQFLGVPIPGTKETKRVRRFVEGYQGNKIFNVRPQDFLPDPRVGMTDIQAGEFCGHRVSIPWNDVVKRAAAGAYYNLKEVSKACQSYYAGRGEPGYTLSGLAAESGDFHYAEEELRTGDKPAIVDAVEMTMEIIPKDIGMGTSTYPEKWVFTLAFDEVLIGAQPLGADHDKFPYFMQSYEFDPYSFSSRGVLEILKPLSDTLDWLFNSHMFNVRKSLNNQWVVNPSMVYEKDLRDSSPGKLIRLRPKAYSNVDVRSVIHQLDVQDVTANNLKNVEALIDIVQRISGVNDNLMGMVNPGGRKTATEVRSSSSAGINRLKTIAEYNSALGWDPLSQVLVQNTQQEYDMEQTFRIVGDIMQTSKYIPINRDDIQGFFDFVPVDGTFPIDRFAQANMWKEILGGIVKIPQIAAQYDLGGIFIHLAQLAGLKNVTQFRVQPDQMVAQQAQAGNIVPMRGGGPTDIGVRQAAEASMRENAGA